MRTLQQTYRDTISIWSDALECYSWSVLAIQPASGGWSLGQVYRHVIDESRFHFEQINGCFAADAVRNGEPTAEGIAMLNRNAFPDIRIDGPFTGVAIAMPANKELLRQELAALVTEMEQLSSRHDLLTATGKTLHPGLGYLTAVQWLQFSEMHSRHHLRQKSRLDAMLKERGLIA